ncbi:MAG: hypothetical protein Q9207_003352 [Kuettlingeria erythrocarpa]
MFVCTNETKSELIYPRNLPLGARTEEGFPRPNQFGISDYDDVRLPTPDGETLSCFFIRPSNKRQAKKLTILMFHGNAGNVGHRVPIAKVLEEHIGCNVFMLEYRGYGLSTGTPDEDGINIDAQTAIDYIRQQEETRHDKIIIYGESIGGACAIRLVANNQEAGDIAGLILINTFTSMRKLIPSALPPAKYIAGLCHQQWNSEKELPRITGIPIMFMSGLKDEIVPPSHMKELFSVCRAQKKIWREFPNGSHNDTLAEPGFFDQIVEFVRDVLDAAPRPVVQQTDLPTPSRGNHRRPHRGTPARNPQNRHPGSRPPPIPGDPPNDLATPSHDPLLASGPASMAQVAQPSSAVPSSAENSAAEKGAASHSRGGSNNLRRGPRGGRRGGALRGRGGQATDSGNPEASHVTGIVNGNANANADGGHLPASRKFGGRLTAPAESAESILHSNSTLSADAPEFRPGQQHQTRARNGQGNRKVPAAQHNPHPQHARHRRDSSLKSTAPDIATRTHEDISKGLYECPICTSEVGKNSKARLLHNKETKTVSFLHQGNGDALGATYQRTICLSITRAGVRKISIPDLSLAFHRTLADRPAANLEFYQRSVRIHASCFATLAPVLLVPIWVLLRAAFVARIPRLRGCTIVANTVARRVVIRKTLNLLTALDHLTLSRSVLAYQSAADVDEYRHLQYVTKAWKRNRNADDLAKPSLIVDDMSVASAVALASAKHRKDKPRNGNCVRLERLEPLRMRSRQNISVPELVDDLSNAATIPVPNFVTKAHAVDVGKLSLMS